MVGESPTPLDAPKRHVLALLPLVLAAAIQIAARDLIGYHWALFYPAAFFGFWIGGWRWGLLVTSLATVIMWWFIVPPVRHLVKEAHELVPAGIFFTTGVVFGAFHHRLRKLHDERRVFAALIDASSDFIGIADANGKPRYLNPAGRRMVGLPADVSIESTTIPDYYPEEQRAFVTDVLLKAVLERGQWRGEAHFRNWKTGALIPISQEHFVIRGPSNGRLIGMGTVTRDISDIRRAQDEVEAARVALERALAARDEVLGIVAHDLRNPLNTIMMQSTLMLRSASEQRDVAPFETIRRAATRMNRMIQDLLDVTRLEAGHAIAITREPRSPAQLVAEALEANAASAAKASIVLASDVHDCPDVWADRDRLLQVFDNLIGNALKFTPRDGTITVAAAHEEGDVVFSVSDSGEGLTSDAAAHLFDRFWQAKSDDRRGAGLGMSVSKAIVEGHGGRIWVESTPGSGTRVSFTIPIAESRAGAA